MRTIIAALVASSAIVGLASSASALTIVQTPASANASAITLVRDGCGIGYNRGPLGMCRPNGFPVRYLQNYLGGACPPTYHLGPFGHRCFSNY